MDTGPATTPARTPWSLSAARIAGRQPSTRVRLPLDRDRNHDV